MELNKILSVSVLCLVLSLVHSETVLRKCCPKDEFLKPDEDGCFLPDSEENILLNPQPLVALGDDINLEYGFPKSCSAEIKSEEDFCIDKIYVNASSIITAKVCLNSEDKKETSEQVAFLNNQLLNVRKCCPLGYSFDSRIKNCRISNHDYDIITELYGNKPKLVNIVNEVLNCTDDVIVDIHHANMSIVNSSLHINNSVYYDGSYCIDSTVDGKPMARVCTDFSICSRKICVYKCCPDGHTYQMKKSGRGHECLPSLEPFITDVREYSKGNLVNLTVDVAIKQRYSCIAGKHLLDEYSFILYPTGEAVLRDTNMTLSAGYCMENIEGDKLYTFPCFPADSTESSTEQDEKDFFWYGVGDFISVIFLTATLFVYIVLPELRNLHGKTLMCYNASMILGYICLSYIQFDFFHIRKDICVYIGYTILFTFLVSFSWLNIMCFDIWWTFRSTRCVGMGRKKREWRRFAFYSLYSWGLPCVITALAYVADNVESFPDILKPKIGKIRCYFTKDNFGHYVFFVIPVAIQLSCNLVLFILTAVHCNRVKSDIHRAQAGSKDESRKKRFTADRAKFVMNSKLFVVMGITWVHEVLSTVIPNPLWLWYFGDCFNVLLGIPIFCIFILKRKVWLLLRKKFGRKDIHTPCKSSFTPNSTNYDRFKNKHVSVSSTSTTNLTSSFTNHVIN